MKREHSEKSVLFFRELAGELGLDLTSVKDEEIVVATNKALMALAISGLNLSVIGDPRHVSSTLGVSIMQRIYGKHWAEKAYQPLFRA